MDTRDIIKATESTKRLVQDEDFYKYIFKKTEKIVSVVFYVSNTLETNSNTSRLLEDILTAARAVHKSVLDTLETRAHLAEDSLRTLAHSLISLGSQLRVATTAGLVAPEALTVLVGEIDSVLRGLNKYLVRTSAFDDLDYKVAVKGPVESPRRESTLSNRTVAPAGQSSATTDNSDRQERIKVILSAKGEASIKDIADIITDVSSKTLQREINSMIEDNVVKRQGERRWSKYSLV